MNDFIKIIYHLEFQPKLEKILIRLDKDENYVAQLIEKIKIISKDKKKLLQRFKQCQIERNEIINNLSDANRQVSELQANIYNLNLEKDKLNLKNFWLGKNLTSHIYSRNDINSQILLLLSPAIKQNKSAYLLTIF